MNKKYSGVIVPMITPFTEDGKIDEKAVIKIIENLISNGVKPFILGTTGESESIPDKEKIRLAKIVTEKFNDKTTIFVGIGNNCFNKSVKLAKNFYDLGLSCFVAYLPGYYPISKSEIHKYYINLIENIPGELMLYNITATTNLSIPIDVVMELSKHERIVGIKDSERNIDRLNKLIELIKNREDFSHLVGWAAKSVTGLMTGSDGIVPSTGNLTPGMFRLLYDSAKNGDKKTAVKMQRQTDEIAKVYQKDQTLSESIAALKVLMNLENLCEINVLPPLVKTNRNNIQIIKNEYRELKEKLNKQDMKGNNIGI